MNQPILGERVVGGGPADARVDRREDQRQHEREDQRDDEREDQREDEPARNSGNHPAERRHRHPILSLLSTIFPWPLRRWLLRRGLGWELAPDCRIGLSWITAGEVRMAAGARIGHFTIIRNLDRVELGKSASIGNLNWITGVGEAAAHSHYASETGRVSELSLGEGAAITHQHVIDCTNRVRIGDFTTVAGCRSQILTHAIDLVACRQTSAPVTIGSYCFISTASILLKGTKFPDRSVLGAGSVVTRPLAEPDCLYAGAPARKVKVFPPDAAYFRRDGGWVA